MEELGKILDGLGRIIAAGYGDEKTRREKHGHRYTISELHEELTQAVEKNKPEWQYRAALAVGRSIIFNDPSDDVETDFRVNLPDALIADIIAGRPTLEERVSYLEWRVDKLEGGA